MTDEDSASEPALDDKNYGTFSDNVNGITYLVAWISSYNTTKLL